MSSDLEQLLRAHIQEVRAHIAAAAAWRRLMNARAAGFGGFLVDDMDAAWRDAEVDLAVLLDPPL